jgi:F-type H+-transporting ATPase subunit delta
MTNRKLARRYAQALFEVWHEGGEPEELHRQIELAADLVARDPELAAILDHPLIPAADKKQRLGLAVRDVIAPVLFDFFCLLIDRRRVRYLPAIREELDRLIDQRRGVIRAEVTSAVPLAPAEVAALEAQLSRLFQARPITTATVDPELIGGMVVRVGDTEMDGSLRRTLERLRQNLHRARLARPAPDAASGAPPAAGAPATS